MVVVTYFHLHKMWLLEKSKMADFHRHSDKEYILNKEFKSQLWLHSNSLISLSKENTTKTLQLGVKLRSADFPFISAIFHPSIFSPAHRARLWPFCVRSLAGHEMTCLCVTLSPMLIWWWYFYFLCTKCKEICLCLVESISNIARYGDMKRDILHYYLP